MISHFLIMFSLSKYKIYSTFSFPRYLILINNLVTRCLSLKGYVIENMVVSGVDFMFVLATVANENIVRLTILLLLL